MFVSLPLQTTHQTKLLFLTLYSVNIHAIGNISIQALKQKKIKTLTFIINSLIVITF